MLAWIDAAVSSESLTWSLLQIRPYRYVWNGLLLGYATKHLSESEIAASNHAVVKECYDKFKAEYGEAHAREILEANEELDLITKSESQTVGSRAGEFRKASQALVHMVTASRRSGSFYSEGALFTS